MSRKLLIGIIGLVFAAVVIGLLVVCVAVAYQGGANLMNTFTGR